MEKCVGCAKELSGEKVVRYMGMTWCVSCWDLKEQAEADLVESMHKS